MAKKRYYNDKMREKEGMLKEDRSKHANLPTEVMMKEYPRQDYLMQDYGDTMMDTDMYFNNAVMGARKQKARKKY